MTSKRKFNSGYRTKIDNFKGGYISHIPEIQSIPLDEKTRGLIMATDGLWDELSNEDVTQLYEMHGNAPDKFLKESLEKALEVASTNSKITVAQLKKIEVGRRRSLHDDITLLYVDLKNLNDKGN